MVRTPNTLDAHRIIRLAGEGGVQDAVVEALFLAHFTDGRDLSDRATLAEIAAGSGLDRAEVEGILAEDVGLDVVRAGEEHASRLGVSGVPFFVVNGRVALSGARPPELFRQAFEQAGDSVGAGNACEGDPTTGKRECQGVRTSPAAWCRPMPDRVNRMHHGVRSVEVTGPHQSKKR